MSAWSVRGMATWTTAAAIGLAVFHCFASGAKAGSPYPWLQEMPGREPLSARIAPPSGYERVSCAEGSFACWLRGLPLREPGTAVRLFDGRVKSYQAGAFAVLDVDVGATNLQQCADAVIRLRAEYLRQAGCSGRIAFDFTSGDRARWRDWSAGSRPRVSGSTVTWARQASPDSSYRAFRSYLDAVFTYAGSSSLAREMESVEDPRAVRPGDAFIHGGFPGHAVLVADVAQDARGERVFLLLQSYMPAQDIHLLRAPGSSDDPWYRARGDGQLVTPEWTFAFAELRRFADPDCEGAARGGSPAGADR